MKDRTLEVNHLVVARDENANVRLTLLAIAGVAYLTVLVALVELAQVVIVAEDFEKYLVGVLLAPLALASMLPPPPERTSRRTVGVTVSAAVGGAGPGVAIGAALAAPPGGVLVPAGAVIGGVVGALIDGGAGLAATWSGKEKCIRRGQKHSPGDYVCPNTRKYNLQPTDLKITPDSWFSEEDAVIYLGVNFDLTVDEAEKAAKRIYERAWGDSNLRKSSLGSETRIFHDDFVELVGREDWLAGENDT